MAIALYTLIFGATLAVFAEAQQPSINCDSDKTIIEISNSCGNNFYAGLNSTAFQEIFNTLLSNNYGRLTFSHRLTLEAQFWVNQCRPGPNPCFQSPGETLEIVSKQTTMVSAAQLIRLREQSRGDGSPSSRSNNTYDSTIGCGFIISNMYPIFRHRLLCYFGSGGNING